MNKWECIVSVSILITGLLGTIITGSVDPIGISIFGLLGLGCIWVFVVMGRLAVR